MIARKFKAIVRISPGFLASWRFLFWKGYVIRNVVMYSPRCSMRSPNLDGKLDVFLPLLRISGLIFSVRKLVRDTANKHGLLALTWPQKAGD